MCSSTSFQLIGDQLIQLEKKKKTHKDIPIFNLLVLLSFFFFFFFFACYKNTDGLSSLDSSRLLFKFLFESRRKVLAKFLNLAFQKKSLKL